ncbi:hypothetical protein [Kitasatospora sp. NPDC101183]|uniref:hypothetical protein n=1 Tax=Kitasatospora sp. NPDC101183 TaxID=3364100 RepID=UPI003823C684
MTIGGEDDLTTRLTALADGTAPPQRLDTARCIVEGTARLRRRRRALVGAAAVVTAVVVTTTALIVPGKPALTGPAPAVVEPAPSSVIPARPDPLIPELRFGWLPDWVGGETGISYDGLTAPGETHGVVLEARRPGKNGARLQLSQLTSFGDEPPSLPGSDARREEAEPVDGRSAHWVVSDTHPEQGLTLEWQTPSGRWARLLGYGGGPTDVSREVLHRVADGVRYGTWEVPLPVRITGLPDTFDVSGARLDRPGTADTSPWHLSLTLRVNRTVVRLTVEPEAAKRQIPSAPTDAGPGLVKCSTDDGVQVCADIDSATPPPALVQQGGLPWLLARTKALGLDPRTWTTDPFV